LRWQKEDWQKLPAFYEDPARVRGKNISNGALKVKRKRPRGKAPPARTPEWGAW